MTEELEKTSDKKLVAIFLIIFVFFSTVILSLGAYYGQNNGQVAGEKEASEIAKLTETYRSSFKQAFQGYLILDTDTDWSSDDLLAKTTTIKNTLLALKVPAEFKDSHLETIIALTEIEAGIKSKKLDLVLPNVYKLREIISNF